MSLETKDLVAALKRRPLITVCAALCVLFGLALYFRLDVPSELSSRLAEREKELKRLSNNVKFSAQLDAHLQALRKANETIQSGALRASELARNQQVFFRLESESGVKLVDIRQLAVPAPAKGAPAPVTYATIPFSLTVRGDYEQILGFLDRLDHCPTLSRVSTAAVARPEAGVHTLSLNVELLGLRQ